MQHEMPDLYRQLVALRNTLEAHYHEVQEYEYTSEQGTLYCLQTRTGKMNAVARVRTAVEMVHEGLISKEQPCCGSIPASLSNCSIRVSTSGVRTPLWRKGSQRPQALPVGNACSMRTAPRSWGAAG
jgi:hypothetical protein